MKAYELLEQMGWCQGANARNWAGKKVDPHHKSACRFCLIGALDKIYDATSIAMMEAKLALYQQRVIPHNMGLAEWNDAPGRTKEEVIAALKQADI